MKTDLVVAGYLVHNDKVLLIHHQKLNVWIPPGGHIDENETPDNALKRELKEELNLEIEILNQTDLPLAGSVKKQLATPFCADVHNVGDHDHCCFFYLCRVKNPDTLSLRISEIKNSAWFSEQDLHQEKVPADVRNRGLKALRMLRKDSV